MVFIQQLNSDTVDAHHIKRDGVEITGGVSDHTLLSNIGTHTHAQIDTHIGDGTLHVPTGLQVSGHPPVTGFSIDMTQLLLDFPSPTVGLRVWVEDVMRIVQWSGSAWETDTSGKEGDLCGMDIGGGGGGIFRMMVYKSHFSYPDGSGLVIGPGWRFLENTLDHTIIGGRGLNAHSVIDTHLASVSGHTYLGQDVRTSASPTFTGMTVNGPLTAPREHRSDIVTVNRWVRLCLWGSGAGQIGGVNTFVPYGWSFTRTNNDMFEFQFECGNTNNPQQFAGRLGTIHWRSGLTIRLVAYSDTDGSGHLYMVTATSQVEVRSRTNSWGTQSWAPQLLVDCGPSAGTPTDLTSGTVLYDSNTNWSGGSWATTENRSWYITSNNILQSNVNLPIILNAVSSATTYASGALGVRGGMGVSKNIIVNTASTFNSDLKVMGQFIEGASTFGLLANKVYITAGSAATLPAYNLNIAAGSGYVILTDTQTLVSWSATTYSGTIADLSLQWIVVNSSGVVSARATLPTDTTTYKMYLYLGRIWRIGSTLTLAPSYIHLLSDPMTCMSSAWERGAYNSPRFPVVISTSGIASIAWQRSAGEVFRWPALSSQTINTCNHFHPVDIGSNPIWPWAHLRNVSTIFIFTQMGGIPPTPLWLDFASVRTHKDDGGSVPVVVSPTSNYVTPRIGIYGGSKEMVVFWSQYQYSSQADALVGVRNDAWSYSSWAIDGLQIAPLCSVIVQASASNYTGALYIPWKSFY